MATLRSAIHFGVEPSHKSTLSAFDAPPEISEYDDVMLVLAQTGNRSHRLLDMATRASQLPTFTPIVERQSRRQHVADPASTS